MPTTVLAADNFLLPNGTLIAELVAFLIILWVLWKYVVPPLSKSLQDRQDMIQKQVEDSEAAQRRLKSAEERYDQALAEARTEAAKIRDNARADGERIREELREQVNAEVERIRQRGEEQLAGQREQVVRQLRGELGGLSVQLAEKLVGHELSVDEHRQATVDDFLAQLGRMPGTQSGAEGAEAKQSGTEKATATTGTARRGELMAVQLRAASRETLAEAETQLDSRVESSSVTELGILGEELFALERLLVGEPALRRHLTDSSVPGRNRSQLADQLFARQVGRAALDTVSELASGRWSRPIDLIEVLQVLARRATIAVAEKDDSLSEVEDELFRFGRILDREPALSALLADTTTPAQGRVALLDAVLGEKVSPVTKALLEQTVRTSRDHNLDLAAEELSELAAARRDRYVAHVGTPVALTAAQEQQLTDTLSRLYGRQMSLQIELNPELLGGLVVRVGGEVIDGSVSSRLSAAKRALPK